MGFAGSPKEFFWGFDFASIRSSPSLEIRSTSPLPAIAMTDYNDLVRKNT